MLTIVDTLRRSAVFELASQGTDRRNKPARCVCLSSEPMYSKALPSGVNRGSATEKSPSLEMRGCTIVDAAAAAGAAGVLPLLGVEAGAGAGAVGTGAE